MATSDSCTSRATWTAFPSLLTSLSPEEQLLLEQASEARQCGLHQIARDIFDERFPNKDRKPILIFEYADLLTDQGLEGERASFLHKCMTNSSLPHDSDEHYLLNLMLADAKMWAFGNLEIAVQTARQSQSWLDVNPKDSISDLQIRGIQLYHQMMYRGLSDSNWVESSEVTTFSSSAGSLYTENTALALAMQQRGNLPTAARFRVDQINAADHIVLPKLCDELAAFCEKLDESDSPPLIYRAAYTRWTLARCCPKSHADLAQRCRQAVVSQLQKLASLKKPPIDWQAYAPKISAKMHIEGFDPQSLIHSAPSPEHLQNVADQALSRGDAMTAMAAMESAFHLLANTANQLADQQSSRRLVEELSQLLDLHRQTTKSLFLEAKVLMQLLLLVDLRGKAYESILDEVAQFQTRAPIFNVPLLLERLYDLARLAAGETGRIDLLNKYKGLHAEAVGDMAGRLDQSPLQNSAVLIRIKENAKDHADWGRHAVEITLLWAADEVRLGEMSEGEWKVLFGFYHPIKQPRSPTFLDFLSRVQAESRNFSKTYFEASRDEWYARLEGMNAWLSKEGSHIPRDSRNTVLDMIAKAWLFKQRKDWIQKIHTGEENAAFAEQRSADEDLASRLGSLTISQSPSMVGLPASLAVKEESVFRVILQVMTDNKDRVMPNIIDNAIQDSNDVAAEYEKRQNYLGMFNIFRRQGELFYQKHMRDPTHSVTTLDNALASLLRAAQVFDEVRRSRSVPLSQRYSIAAKMQQLRKFDASGVYAKGIAWNRRAWNIKYHLYGQLETQPMPSNEDPAAREQREARIRDLRLEFENSYASFLLWIQRSKGRALLDLLSVDTPIPRDLLDRVNEDHSAKSLIESEQKLVQQLDESPFTEKIRLRRELDEKRAQMRVNPLLAEIMRIRDGDTITPYEINDILGELTENVILVDFFYVDFDKPLRAVCYRKGLTYFPALMTDVDMDAIATWTKYIEHPDEKPLSNAAAGKEALAQLTSLLLPMFKVGKGSPNRGLGPVIRPNDTIVFCPTGPLHLLPLHAIPIDGVPIIETHPVVYCPNLSVFRHCFRSLRDAAMPIQNKDHPKRLVLNTMPSHWPKNTPDSAPDPVTSISTSSRLSNSLHAEFRQGCKYTKDEIKSLLPGTALFHYHGHVFYKAKDAMQSSLILDGKDPEAPKYDTKDTSRTQAEAQSKNGRPRNSSRLTAEDIFDCPLAKGGALATLIGCRSGGADVSAADDVLGLPMAFFYANATAVVSSLWELSDEDGAKWAEEFYGELVAEQQRNESHGGKVTYIDTNKMEIKSNVDTENVGVSSSIEQNETKPDFLNLAKAMQTAVRKLRFDEHGVERAPYHWAGYVLSGYWMFPRTIVSS